MVKVTMPTKFDALEDAHLEELLRRAELNLAEDTPIALRSAALYILDYYQAILREAALKVDVDLEGAAIPLRISKVRSSIGGLQIDGLEGLESLRTAVYHYENRVPDPKALHKYLKEARGTRQVLQNGAQTALAKEKTMTRTAQRLRAGGEELLRLLSSIQSEKARASWKAKAERAVQVATENPRDVGEDGVELLVEVVKQIASIYTFEEVLGLNQEPPDEDFSEEYQEPSPEELYGEPDYSEEAFPEPDFDPSDFYPDESSEENHSEDEEPRKDDPSEGEPRDHQRDED